MLMAFGLSFVPILPGPLLPWAVGIAFGFLNSWQRLTPAAGISMTVLMLIGVTADYWRPLLGAKSGGLTCLASIGSFVGGIIGTIAIPIPIVGTLVGCVVGALAVELVKFGDLQKALGAGRSAFKLFVLGYVLNIAISLAIVVVYVVSLLTTG
jgi:uncharacterized protein YqgC (DUF456 family)